MKTIFIYSLIESLYILYMYNLFKTKYFFHNPIEIFLQNTIFKDNNTMKHEIKNTDYSSKICKFGKIISVILVILIYIRYQALVNKNYKNMIFYTKITLIIVSIFSLILNMNAFIYLLPVFIYELYLINNNFLINRISN
jgi:hypothetical protein